MEGYKLPVENQDNPVKPEKADPISEYTKSTETQEEISAKEVRKKSDADKLDEVRASLGMSPLQETPVESKIEEPKQEQKTEKLTEQIEVDESLKRKGLDFTESMNRVNGRLGRIDKETEVVSPGTISRFKTATRNLEASFQGQKFDLKEAEVSFGRLTTSFEDLSLINDRDLMRVTEDARKSLVSAVESSKDSAMALRTQEKMQELQKNINRMIDKADSAAHRLRRGVR